MTVLLDATLPRWLDTLVDRFASPGHRGLHLDAWLFEDRAARNAAASRLAEHGVTATLRSAYKPLLHVFLEDIPLDGASAVTIALPSHPLAPAPRFQVEAYPLAGMLAPLPVTFLAGTSPDHYEVSITDTAGMVRNHQVFVPCKTAIDMLGREALVPSGWLRLRRGDAAPHHDAAEMTEYQAAFAAAMAAVRNHAWPSTTPFFDTLEIDIATAGIERKIAWHDECLSTREALHEDLYFSLLEMFRQIGGRSAADRDFQPGQIVPLIRAASGPTTVRVTVGPHRPNRPRSQEPERLEHASRPLTQAQVDTALASLGGEPFEVPSVQGRAVRGRLFAGPGPGLVITAGQHANETSGVIGALRAAPALIHRGGLALAVIAQENPDGYALHHRLRAENPRHMHHAARFTALGDDLEYRSSTALHEKAARLDAFARTGARLHINLHGYPAHEWTRPLTGYLPTGYEPYALPKGFFLIIRHHPGLADQAQAFIEALSARLITDPALAALNHDQIAAYRAHYGEIGHPIHNGIVCMVGENAAQVPPFVVITEYPDETIYGDAFRLAHTTQMNAVLHAAALLRDQGLLD